MSEKTIKITGTNIIARDENKQIYEDFIPSEKVLLRAEVMETLPEGHTLISVEKSHRDITLSSEQLTELIKGAK